ncbi:hypothetical protein M9434_001550 [Picochlorum sp. BPE23]|nr:hypothetical protein M9434_001550 [Picochlorum sp. BPE23]
MSRRRQRLDLTAQPTGLDESRYIEHLDHILECPLFQYLEQEPKIVSHSSPAGTHGWKKVSLGPEMEYYWHVESGKVSRECPGDGEGHGIKGGNEYRELVESLQHDAVRLAQKQDDLAVQAAVVSRIADGMLRAYDTMSSGDSSVEDVWSAVFRVMSDERRDAFRVMDES